MLSTIGKRLRARLGHGEGWTALRLDGVIDEQNELDQMVDGLIGAPMLIIDLGGVSRINSVGVRDWVLWLRALKAHVAQIILFDCPPAIMNEVNLVKNFAEGALIVTFQAPYYCERCGKEEVRTLDAIAMARDGQRRAPAFPCERAACANALDDVEESYFAFFDDQREIPIPMGLSEILAAARDALREGGAVELPTPKAPTPTPAAATRRPLDSIGHSAARAREGALTRVAQPAPPGTPAAPSHASTLGGFDLVFAAVLTVMLAVLGVLIYLITTLE